MRIRTLLNKCHRFKSFVYKNESMEIINDQECLVVEIEPRKNSKPICANCGKPGNTYDHQPKPRYFEFIPIWGFVVYLSYVMRRVNCIDCGVKIEQVPWARGKAQQTLAYQVFLSRWARRLSWKEVADSFNTTWGKVYRAIQSMVEFGLKNRNLDGITAIGVDEIQFGKGHNYVTVVYQLDQGQKRLLHVTQGRSIKSFLRFFRMLGKERTAQIQYVCSDMWRAYLRVIKKKLPHALHILDRFHIVKKLNEAVDGVRKEETKEMKNKGFEPILKSSKYCFLKNEENLTESQQHKLNELLQYNLKTVRAYLLKESFQAYWQYLSPYWADRFLTLWCKRAMRSRLEPMKKFVKTVRRHQPLMMNWFKAKKVYSSGTVEGLNRKVNLVTRKSYGFKSYETLEIALYHAMGGLPEPKLAHRFC